MRIILAINQLLYTLFDYYADYFIYYTQTCARRRQLGWFVSGLPWGIEPHDIPIGEQWGGR